MEIHLEHKFLSVQVPIHMTLGDLFLRMSEACFLDKMSADGKSARGLTGI